MTTKSIGTADAANVVDLGGELSSRAFSRRLLLGGAAAGGIGLALGAAAPPATAAPVAPVTPSTPALPRTRHYPAKTPLWRIAADARLAYGTSHTSRLFDDVAYSDLVDAQAAILFTEDDLLWYQLKPTPDSPLDFSFGDKLYARAKRDHQLVFAAHLVWDEGFGDGWGEDFSTLYELNHDDASDLLFGVEKALVKRYRGRTVGWIVANEVTDPEGENGLRTEVPWYQTIGSGYVAKAFRLAKKYDRHAVRVINEFGFESTNEYDDDPEARQQAMLTVLKKLRRDDVPVDALGIQAHLNAKYFLSDFDPKSYRRFLNKVADLGVDVLITEMDVLDDGLPVDPTARDAAVAECYARYLENVLPNRDVKALMTFGLSDRYTWLQEDYPRDDGAARRPLPYDDEALKPKLAYEALRHALADAPKRRALWHLPKHR